MADRYNPQVIDHLVRPRNVGELETPGGFGESGDAACGDVVRFTVRIEENRLEEIRYKVYGCAACIAAGSALSELVRGRSLPEAARVSKADLEGSLGGPLPKGKEHALTLVLDALHKALEDHWNRQAGEMLVEGYAGGSDSETNGRKKSVVAAMSGGVDSAVTALLLKEAGYDVVTVTFRLHEGDRGSRSCCSPDTVLFARDTAHRMGLPHFTLNLKELFDRRVMKDFVGSYAAGRTPNPCVSCNAHVKFHAASFLADRLGLDHVATGHYARVVEEPGGAVTMARPVDASKDQTYVLWPVPRELLSRTIFPLGEYRKEEVRCIAEERGLAVAYTPESQDICFIPDGDYRGFVRKKVAAEPGEILDTEGRTLGRHAGVVDFTVGQRRGIGVSAPTPLYVTEVRSSQKQVVVGRRKDLEVSEVRIGDLNWFLEPGEADSVQVRYNSPAVPCEVEDLGNGEVRARLAEAVMGVAPGQSAVFYKGERVVGGGVVRRDA
ncbi:MAG: tRNA-specific 2-thiouridylase MnmA [uncultured Rubrobacteraceae bacterium]|uniref:tRNA-specific 2-thiouridylase MnmA n=1 Tax=uncultured Rubrobacteraceae bacterium TaxID=349277 RepID=A0A6J4Q0F9_9ACTN|nr:MAG: tRNA-specific 2-thiouridylase MnmA [uncultured Rubrobacteraceae bacterium]